MKGSRESLFAHTWWQWTGELRPLLPTTSRCGQGISQNLNYIRHELKSNLKIGWNFWDLLFQPQKIWDF